ncbi:hypothetical protein [Ornithinimicrobium sp. INDO-MA30-4]|uniref:hypothetical protein n=1 Tax=Ornithinimicrobium sp. INDO-MA30-4 TaxID=2908651 RepID=UPI001F3ADABD|nr:hypothetical protein [Ornithinimicrobium sp. INDO-MA30-4]UJH70898.1 hypothetical protein L0A91_02670 [Ornithinimicrobium sp. INDO-MA30-4]
MAARRQVTNKLWNVYRGAGKHDKARFLDEVMASTGMGRSTARWMVTGPAAAGTRVDADGLPPCGKHLVVMLELWLPLLEEVGDLDKPFATAETVVELKAMSVATIDRYLAAVRRSMQLRGIVHEAVAAAAQLDRTEQGRRRAADCAIRL